MFDKVLNSTLPLFVSNLASAGCSSHTLWCYLPVDSGLSQLVASVPTCLKHVVGNKFRKASIPTIHEVGGTVIMCQHTSKFFATRPNNDSHQQCHKFPMGDILTCQQLVCNFSTVEINKSDSLLTDTVRVL